MRITIDGAGRIVVPKALRDPLGLNAGQALEIGVRDGRLEIEATSPAGRSTGSRGSSPTSGSAPRSASCPEGERAAPGRPALDGQRARRAHGLPRRFARSASSHDADRANGLE